jgi:hypothetical protein
MSKRAMADVSVYQIVYRAGVPVVYRTDNETLYITNTSAKELIPEAQQAAMIGILKANKEANEANKNEVLPVSCELSDGAMRELIYGKITRRCVLVPLSVVVDIKNAFGDESDGCRTLRELRDCASAIRDEAL